MESWPPVDERLIDASLEEDMASLRRVLEAALNARNQAGVKLRWPLRKLVVSSNDESIVRAAGRLSGLLRDQSNCKQAATVKGEWGERTASLSPVMKAIGPAFGRNASAVAASIKSLGPKETGELLSGKTVQVGSPGGPVDVTPSMVTPSFALPDGFVECAFEGGTVYLDTRLDDELRAEGLGRDIVRRFQQMRKDAGLQVEDRILAYAILGTGQSVMLARWRELIMNETRAVDLKLSEGPLQELVELCAAPIPGSQVREWELDSGEKVLLGIKRA
jgi:isoleucyl-tRNA synthetase